MNGLIQNTQASQNAERAARQSNQHSKNEEGFGAISAEKVAAERVSGDLWDRSHPQRVKALLHPTRRHGPRARPEKEVAVAATICVCTGHTESVSWLYLPLVVQTCARNSHGGGD